MEKDGAQDPVVTANLRKLMRNAKIGGIGALRLAMAERGIKIGAGTIQRALEGAGKNRVETLGKLAQFFDVTTDQLLQADLGLDEPALPGEPARPGRQFDAITDDLRQLLEDFNTMMDEDQAELAAEIHKRAEKIRAHMRKISEAKGIPLVAESANARRQRIARDEVKVGPALKQRDLLPDVDE